MILPKTDKSTNYDKPHPSQSNSFPCVFPWVYYFYFNSTLDFYSLLKIIVMENSQIKRYQPLLKLNDFILINGNRRKVIYIANTGIFEWNGGFANINQLETNENPKSKIIFKLTQ